jgi:acyl-CoA synthetase (AMP-forming)/AMP-acid ligase II
MTQPSSLPVTPTPKSGATAGSRLVDIVRTVLNGPANAPALCFDGQWIDWGAVRATADAVNDALIAAGVGPEMPVGFAPRNRPGFTAALLALLAAERPIVMVYAYQSADAMAGDVRRKGLAALICAGRDWTPEVVAAARTIGCCGISLGEAITGAALVPGLEKVHSRSPAPRSKPEVVLLTSGTTGPPKSFPMSYDLIARAMLDENIMTGPEVDLPPALLFFPLGNIAGLYSLLPVVLRRRSAIMIEKFDIGVWADYIRTYRPTSINVPPAGVRMALDRQIPVADLASLKFITSGAAALDPNIHRTFEQTYGIPILLSYGATEFGGPVTLMTPALQARWGDAKFGTVGLPWAGAQLRIVDPETGAEKPADAEGLLEVMAPRIGPEWIRTSDLATIDRDGFVFIRGRADGAISRGGFKIMPETVERALMLHPAVGAAAVVGLPDERLGEAPVAVIELREDLAQPSPAELEAHVRKHVYATHVPVQFKIVTALPRTPSLKVDLAAVRALFLASKK